MRAEINPHNFWVVGTSLEQPIITLRINNHSYFHELLCCNQTINELIGLLLDTNNYLFHGASAPSDLESPPMSGCCEIYNAPYVANYK